MVAALVLLAIVAASAVLFATSAATPDLTGRWKSWRSDFRISRERDIYTIVVNNPNGLLGGTYTGMFRHGAIHVTGPLAPLCGQIKYSRDTDKLEFCGEEFMRARN